MVQALKDAQDFNFYQYDLLLKLFDDLAIPKIIKITKKLTFEEAKIAIQCSLNPLEDIEKEIKKYDNKRSKTDN